MKRLATIFAAAVALAVAGHALAADEEIQVYEDDMDNPGQFGLDVHNNYVFSGQPGIEYPGEQASLDRYRMTPEWSYGLAKNFELGLYLPLTTLDAQGHFQADGFKGRIKFIAPRPESQNWYWGLNFEIGRVAHFLAPDPWNAELKGILGAHLSRWTLATNLNVDWAVAGPQPEPATLELDTKVSYSLTRKFAVGFESYNGSGTFRRFGAFAESDQALYGAIDATLGKWDFNFGLGHGYGTSTDGWVMKAIISVPIDN